MRAKSEDSDRGDGAKDDEQPEHQSHELALATVMDDEAEGDIEKCLPQASIMSPVEPPHEQTNLSTPVAKDEFSVFTTGQKRWIVVAASFAAWFSPMTGSIYYPALNQIAGDLHVSSAKINLTITTYMIFQGLAPMMIAGFSERSGRKPAYIICFATYMVANLALALQNNYVALLVLRMLQSAGSSGTVALANGVVGDCIVSSERGEYIAYASIGTILGPSVSPVLGGIISQYAGWHWIFWFLFILAGAFFIPLWLFLPETCRKIADDGSVPPPWTSWNLTDRVRFRNRAQRGIVVDEAKLQRLRKNYKITFPNPISTLKILADPESALLLFGAGAALACFFAISTGAPQAYQEIYGFDELQISLMFLPIGAGSVVSAFTTGKLVDWNYRRHARRLGYPVVKNRQTDLGGFPIETARLQVGIPCFVVGTAVIVAYGWMLDRRVPVAGPAVLLFLLGYTLMVGAQCLTVLIVDIHPSTPATAAAANNVLRCGLGAAASAAIDPMVRAMGYGGAYMTIAAVFLLGSLGPLVSMQHGIAWRQARREREERRAKKKAARAEEKKTEQGEPQAREPKVKG